MRDSIHRSLEDAKREQELERALRRLSSGEDPQEVLEAFSRRLTNKLLHDPTVTLYRLPLF
jgi:glutamyl-tRNA reductase